MDTSHAQLLQRIHDAPVEISGQTPELIPHELPRFLDVPRSCKLIYHLDHGNSNNDNKSSTCVHIESWH